MSTSDLSTRHEQIGAAGRYDGLRALRISGGSRRLASSLNSRSALDKCFPICRSSCFARPSDHDFAVRLVVREACGVSPSWAVCGGQSTPIAWAGPARTATREARTPARRSDPPIVRTRAGSTGKFAGRSPRGRRAGSGRAADGPAHGDRGRPLGRQRLMSCVVRPTVRSHIRRLGGRPVPVGEVRR